ncbi:hypothetical protein Goshw_023412 [Gossypium schwendimanii]|uniref:Uncharacterized protein n=1 Tax=Gossypium schwendimanii TaxID=34291 RepID=A0A7J9KU72_GOSSC|nr:hypothetical protein [Gossypium schwendimanii]
MYGSKHDYASQNDKELAEDSSHWKENNCLSS